MFSCRYSWDLDRFNKCSMGNFVLFRALKNTLIFLLNFYGYFAVVVSSSHRSSLGYFTMLEIGCKPVVDLVACLLLNWGTPTVRKVQGLLGLHPVGLGIRMREFLYLNNILVLGISYSLTFPQPNGAKAKEGRRFYLFVCSQAFIFLFFQNVGGINRNKDKPLLSRSGWEHRAWPFVQFEGPIATCHLHWFWWHIYNIRFFFSFLFRRSQLVTPRLSENTNSSLRWSKNNWPL